MNTDKILDDLRVELARVEPEATALQERARELAEKAKAASENVARLKKAIAALDEKAEPLKPFEAVQLPHGTVPFIPSAPPAMPWFPRWPRDIDHYMPWRLGDVICRDDSIALGTTEPIGGIVFEGQHTVSIVAGGECIPNRLRDTYYAS